MNIIYKSGKLPIIAVNGQRIASGSRWGPEEQAKIVTKDFIY